MQWQTARDGARMLRRLPGYPDFFGAGNKMGSLVILVGVAGGLFGVLYLKVLHLLTHVLGPDHWSRPVHCVVLLAVGLAAGAIIHFIGNPGGIDVLVDNIHVKGGWRDIRSLRSLLPVSLLCIAAGGAAGPEAPLVQSNGGLGSLVGYFLRLPPNKVRILTITGMASGFSVLFGVPIGAAVFALEFLHREGMEYYEAILPAAWGALVGYIAYVFATGAGLSPVWEFPAPETLVPMDFAWALGAGVLSAGIGTVFAFVVSRLRQLFLRIHVLLRLCLGGAILGGLSWLSIYALTFGEYQLMSIVTAPPAASFFLMAAAMKFLGTSFTMASGWRGGFIIPLFFIGACLGRFFSSLLPGANETVLMTALMAGLNAGVTKTPLGSTLVVTTMAHLSVIPTTLLSALTALSLTKSVRVIGSQRSRRLRRRLSMELVRKETAAPAKEAADDAKKNRAS